MWLFYFFSYLVFSIKKKICIYTLPVLCNYVVLYEYTRIYIENKIKELFYLYLSKIFFIYFLCTKFTKLHDFRKSLFY